MSLRRRNWRFVGTGGMLLALAGVFFVLMLSMAAKSTDPVALMRTVGQVCGVAGGVGLVLVVLGLVGKPAPANANDAPKT